MTAGYSGTPLARKLGIRQGHRVVALFAPDQLEELLDPLPGEVVVERDVSAGPFDVILLFVLTRAQLDDGWAAARPQLDERGGLWVAFPKKKAKKHRKLHGEMPGDQIRAYGLGKGLVDNKVCAIDDDWSGLRFVVRVADRTGGRR